MKHFQPVFENEMSATSAADLEASTAVATDPVKSSLQQITPDLIKSLETQNTQIAGEMAALRAEQEATLDAVNNLRLQTAALPQLAENLSNLVKMMGAIVGAVAGSPEVQTSIQALMRRATLPAIPALLPADHSLTSPSLPTLSPPGTVVGQDDNSSSIPGATGVIAEPCPTEDLPVRAPSTARRPMSNVANLMPRSTKTVAGYWAEYELGAHGNEPLKDIEKREGRRWRCSPADSKKWSRRKTFYDAIKKRVEVGDGVTGAQVADMLDLVMYRETWGLENMRTRLRKGTFVI
ncbi:hypothetical protein DFS34DRAFT_227801 [Phlyctochytrium arcticum]|nr:hypothetical protein DFS34DRAFT_227801 [Phlyctochytrium arcticum]